MKTTRTYEFIAGKIAEHIEGHLETRLTIRHLAAQFQISDHTLKKIFRVVFQKTVHGYILEHRLQRAHELLLTTDLPVKTIALDTGFRSLSAFLFDFKNKFHLTPTELRDRGTPGESKKMPFSK